MRIRALSALSAASAVAVTSALVAIAPPAHASDDSMSFSVGGGDHVSLQANGTIMIDGSLAFDNECLTGIRDFVYPATDVYLVESGSAQPGAKLVDAGGGRPNTIVAPGTMFLGEVIGFTYPSGKIGDGTFDIVYDTCQDGWLDPEDTVFEEAVDVDVPDGQIPPPSDSIRRMKEAAKEQYLSWIKVYRIIRGLLKNAGMKDAEGCLLDPAAECLAMALYMAKGLDDPYLGSLKGFKDQVATLMGNMAAGYSAIWQDPADPDFEKLPVPAADLSQARVQAGAGSVSRAYADLADGLVRESARAEAMLHALERYQGAQEAGDAEWALVQARAVRDLSAEMAAAGADNGLIAFRSEVIGALDTLMAQDKAGADLADAIRTSGFTGSQRQVLRNNGLTEAQVAALEADAVKGGPVQRTDRAFLVAALDEAVAAGTAWKAAAEESRDGWQTVVDELATRDDVERPVARAGADLTTASGSVTLDGSGSTAPAGRTLTAYAWDVDGDGEFDDAAGQRPAVSVGTSRSIALRVTDSTGDQAFDLVHVAVTTPDRAPVVDSASPGSRTLVQPGTATTFTVTAHDPEGSALSYAWKVDGKTVGSDQGSHTWTPAAADVGAHWVTVDVTSGARTTQHRWAVTVRLADGDQDGWTRSSDCDDTRVDVHPGALERAFNGVDDDCDASTPDAPPTGPTGSVTAWGGYAGTGQASGSNDKYAPVTVPLLGDQVRALDSQDRSGYAVMADGTMRSWGMNFDGKLGDGTQNQRYAPVTVLGVGGAAGSALSGITRTDGANSTQLALGAEGQVFAWGSHANGQVGDGSTVASRPSPVKVARTDGTDLKGAVQVEAGEQSSYAVMGDRSVVVWGVDRCDDDPVTTTKRSSATPNALYGKHVVQLASGDGGGALWRNDDGTVWSCGGYEDTLGRPYSSLTRERPGQVTGFGVPVVDLSMGMGAAVALGEDGSVWMWGKNTNHELDVAGVPIGGRAATPVRVPVPAGAPVVDVDMDYSSTVLALRADGSVLVWGSNPYGAAGIGSTASYVDGFRTIDLGPRTAVAISESVWNGLALTRPLDDPAYDRPAQWLSASVADVTVAEGASGNARLTLSGAAPEALSVTYAFRGTERTVTVPAGATGVDLPFTAPDDALDGDDTTLPLQLVAVSHGVKRGGDAVVTVTDDDAAPTVSIENGSVDEGDTSLTDATLVVRLSSPSGKDVEVPWSVRGVDGTALLPAGTTSVKVHVAVTGDRVVEADEQVPVALGVPVNAQLGRAAAYLTVRDDDAVLVTATGGQVEEPDTGTAPLVLSIGTDELPAGETVTVPWSLVAGTAEAGTDYVDASGSVTLTSDDPTREVTVEVKGDRRTEVDEVLLLRTGTASSSRADRVVLGGEKAAGLVVNDDQGPLVDAGTDGSGAEGSAIALHGNADAPSTWSTDAAGCTIAAPTALDTTISCRDEGTVTVRLTSDDGENPAVSDTATVTVTNAAPVLTVSAPVAGATVQTGQAVQLLAGATDAGADDVLTCTVQWGDGDTGSGCDGTHTYTAPGAVTLRVTVADGDGGTDVRTVALTVTAPPSEPTAWPWEGFFQPVDNLPTVNVVKAGSAVPVKFSVGGYRGMDVIADGYPASSGTSCSATADTDTLEQVATPGASELSYDAATGRYQLVWKTAKSWANTCRTLVVRLADGSTHKAAFRFR